MGDAPSVRSAQTAHSSDFVQSGVGRYHEPLNLPNTVSDLDRRIPFVLTDLGHKEVADWAIATEAPCHHQHHGYDQVDKVWYCDDCGEVHQLKWEGGQVVDRKPV